MIKRTMRIHSHVDLVRKDWVSGDTVVAQQGTTGEVVLQVRTMEQGSTWSELAKARYLEMSKGR